MSRLQEVLEASSPPRSGGAASQSSNSGCRRGRSPRRPKSLAVATRTEAKMLLPKPVDEALAAVEAGF